MPWKIWLNFFYDEFVSVRLSTQPITLQLKIKVTSDGHTFEPKIEYNIEYNMRALTFGHEFP